jgi:hypothetical protein
VGRVVSAAPIPLSILAVVLTVITILAVVLYAITILVIVLTAITILAIVMTAIPRALCLASEFDSPMRRSR